VAKKLIKSFTLEELRAAVRDWGYKPYLANQIFLWLWQKGAEDFSAMTDIAQNKRRFLKDNFAIPVLRLESRVEGKDKTQKFLFSLPDGHKIESVFIPEEDRKTVCLSSQVGCPLGCKLCYTARIGFKRNLKFYEISEQVLMIKKIVGKVTNIVFMGMGEPLLNLDEVIKAVKILSSNFGFKIGQRKITISTVGIIDKIYELADSPENVKLAVSLNSPRDEIRSFLIPINEKYPIAELMKSLHYYVKQKKKRVTFEYVLIKGLNDSEADARLLAKTLKGIPSKINLIPFNPFPGCDFKAPTKREIERFAGLLYQIFPYIITVRKSRGTDILAGCGQLAGDKLP